MSRVWAGVKRALRGIRAVSGNPDVKNAYRFILLGLFVVTLLLTSAGLYGVLHYTAAVSDSPFWEKLGLWLLRIVGFVVVLLAAPLLSITLCNLLFPVFSEIPFFAGLRALAPDRSRQLESRPGLSLGAAIFNSVRRFIILLLITGFCFALGLIPFVGPVLAPPVQFLLSARTIGWEMLDPYFDRCGLDWAAQKRVVHAHAPEVLGLGMVCAPILAIPLIGPLFFGLLQAGTAGFVNETFTEGEADAPLILSES